jgi:hypothetical protein
MHSAALKYAMQNIMSGGGAGQLRDHTGKKRGYWLVVKSKGTSKGKEKSKQV